MLSPQWMVPATVLAVALVATASFMPISMMSISPHLGQFTVSKSLPIIQKAGHKPLAKCGSLMRASIFPWVKETLLRLLTRPEVNDRLP